jgi:hypothetical protein
MGSSMAGATVGRQARDGYRSAFALTPIWCHKVAMEKRRPTYGLDAIKAAIGSAETLAIT